MERDETLIGSSNLTVSGIKEIFEKADLHTGTKFEDRSRAGQVAKVGADVISLALPLTAGTRGFAQGGQLLSKSVDDLSQVPVRTADELGTLGQAADNAAGTARIASEQPSVFSATKVPFKPQNISKEKISATVNDILKASAQNPNTAKIELGSAAGAAQLGMTAEALDPGDEVTRFASEFVGAILNPIGQTVRLGGSATSAIKGAISNLTRGGKEQKAAEVLTEILLSSGDVTTEAGMKKLIATLKSADGIDDNFTSGQKVGLDSLLKLEKWLKTSSGKAGRELSNTSDEMVAKGNAEFIKAIDSMTVSGNPEAVSIAATLREKFVNDTVDSALDVANSRVSSSLSPLDINKTGADTGINTQKLIDEAFGKVKAVESSLWKNVPKDQNVSTVPIKEVLKDIKANRLLKGETFEFQNFVEKMAKRETIKSGEAQLLRSKLMSKSRELRASENNDQAAIMEMVADSIADTMEGLPAWDTARAFTKRINDKFGRTFAGKVIGTRKSGAPIIEPEQILEKGIGPGGISGDVKAGQLRDAVEFSTGKGSKEAGELVTEQSDFIRIAANRLLNEEGKVTEKQLNRFTRNNQALLDRPEFAQVKSDLSNAESAARMLKKVKGSTDIDIDDFRASAAGKMVGDENPVRAIGKMLDGKSPIKDFKELSELATTPAQKEGLARGIFEHVTGKQSTFEGIKSALNDEVYGSKSALWLIQQNKLLDKEGVKKLNVLLDKAVEIEGNVNRGKAFSSEDLTPGINSFFDLIVRIAGAKMGAAGAAGTTGSTIVAAGAGSRFLTNALEKAPQVSVQKIMIEAAENPQFMAALLERGAKGIKIKTNQRIVNQGMVSAGLIFASEDDKEDNVMIRNKDKNFVKRALNPDSSPKITNDDGSKSTHRMASGETDGRFIAYPTITQDKDGSLRQREDNDAFRYAMETGEFIEFDTDQEAKRFASGEYKKLSGWKPDR